MSDGREKRVFSYVKVHLFNLVLAALKMNHPKVNEAISRSGVFPSMEKLLLEFSFNDILCSKFLSIFQVCVDSYYEGFFNSILNYKKLTRFMEDYSELCYKGLKLKKERHSHANPEVLKSMFSKIDSTKNKRLNDPLMEYEIFVNFKASFLKDFRVDDRNFPGLETE